MGIVGSEYVLKRLDRDYLTLAVGSNWRKLTEVSSEITLLPSSVNKRKLKS
jgi:hypothetical protein